MKLLIVFAAFLSVAACAPKVAVDIYDCPVLSDGPEIELKEEVISCPAGKKPIRGGCTLAGSGSIAAGKVDAELCQ